MNPWTISSSLWQWPAPWQKRLPWFRLRHHWYLSCNTVDTPYVYVFNSLMHNLVPIKKDHSLFINYMCVFVCLWLVSTGQYIPLCDEDGYYKPTQCHGSVGQCWCVDRYGNEVMGSRINGVADCGKEKGYLFHNFPSTELSALEPHSFVQAFNQYLLYAKTIEYIGWRKWQKNLLLAC